MTISPDEYLLHGGIGRVVAYGMAMDLWTRAWDKVNTSCTF